MERLKWEVGANSAKKEIGKKEEKNKKS